MHCPSDTSVDTGIFDSFPRLLVLLLRRSGCLVEDEILESKDTDPSDHKPVCPCRRVLPVGQVVGLKTGLDGQGYRAADLSKNLS